MKYDKILGGAALGAMLAFGATTVQAATLSVPGSPSSTVSPGTYDLGLPAQPFTILYFDDGKLATEGLSVSGPATAKLTYVGKEAGYTNLLTGFGAGTIFNTATSSAGDFFTTTVGAGLLDFSLLTQGSTSGIANNGVATGNVRLGFALSDDLKSAFVFFDDDAGPDFDFDDLVFTIEVAPIPLPAGAVLLVTGLAGLAATRRRKTAA